MSESMIERVARAMFLARYPGDIWDPKTAEEYRECARAAIKAMREPTEAMMEEAADEFTFQSGHWDKDTTPEKIQRAVFQRVIGAALSPDDPDDEERT